tara:strand:- start:435 stop:596 length:162 start_codon:yes stop_codon:yes gene_type:complete
MINVIKKYIKELNPKYRRNGFFALKNLGIIFHYIVSISLVDLEIKNYKIKSLE